MTLCSQQRGREGPAEALAVGNESRNPPGRWDLSGISRERRERRDPVVWTRRKKRGWPGRGLTETQLEGHLWRTRRHGANPPPAPGFSVGKERIGPVWLCLRSAALGRCWAELSGAELSSPS